MSDTPKVGIDPMQDPMRPGYFMNYAANETDAEMVLRKLACWLGVGGYNADKVDADVFHAKIVDGINAIVRVEKERALSAERAKNAALTKALQAMMNAAVPNAPEDDCLHAQMLAADALAL